ncbi:hypothetical protein QUF50_07425, partial [Thiotrichales bacterium HSG1]|nr:hypothetical protein [Thiotrichales bacterium HSG1]
NSHKKQAKTANARYKKIKTELDDLTAKKFEVSNKVVQLQENFSEFKQEISSRSVVKPQKTSSVKNIHFNSINKNSNPIKDSPKLEMLKHIVEDNIKLKEMMFP